MQMRPDSLVLFLSLAVRLRIQSSSLLSHRGARATAGLCLAVALQIFAATALAEADVKLVRDIAGSTDTEKLGDISGVYADSHGIHVIAAGGMASFTIAPGTHQATKKRLIAGKQKLFGTRKLVAWGALGNGQWAIAQSSDQRVVVMDDNGATLDHSSD